jgi:hypothetical protein
VLWVVSGRHDQVDTSGHRRGLHGVQAFADECHEAHGSDLASCLAAWAQQQLELLDLVWIDTPAEK